MRLISFGVYVGVIVLQQLAQVKQSTCCHISMFNFSVSLSRSRGGFFSTLVRNRLNNFLYRLTFFLKEYRLTGCMKLSVFMIEIFILRFVVSESSFFIMNF